MWEAELFRIKERATEAMEVGTVMVVQGAQVGTAHLILMELVVTEAMVERGTILRQEMRLMVEMGVTEAMVEQDLKIRLLTLVTAVTVVTVGMVAS